MRNNYHGDMETTEIQTGLCQSFDKTMMTPDKGDY